jgi:DNA-binding CsgD family transcriptional regulator/tetratricopeptide (TPR) repeat protein
LTIADLALPGFLRVAPSYPFAGRARELDVLTALLPRAAGEGRQVALVAGESGSGKSRLVRELAVRLSEEGALVLHGSCDSVVSAPYGPFVEALGELVRGTDASTLRGDLGTGGGELARLLPELAGLVGELPVPAQADADAERLRLHTAASDFLGAVSRRAPVLLALEDVHWADGPSLQLIRHLVRTGGALRVLVLVTYRDHDADPAAALTDMLAEIPRHEGVVRLRLGGLDEAEVTEFVRLAAGAEPRPEVIDAIGELTDGNAFLLTELWRELIDSRGVEIGTTGVQLARPAAAIGTPETVHDVVVQRLMRLPEETRELLDVGALMGAVFELDVVRRATDLDATLVHRALDAASRSGLVLDAPGRRIAYRFSHELVRRAVVDRLSAPRRAELHHRVATALEGEPTAGDPRVLLAALAHHYAEAAAVGDTSRAVSYNLLAAESAAGALAYDEAAERLRTALALGVDDPRERARIWLELGYACHRAGRAVDALAAFREAAALARRLKDGELLARAAIGFEEACWRPAIHDEGAVELLVEAAAVADPAPSELRVRLLGALTRALDFKGSSEAAARARDEAMSMALSIGDRHAYGWVLSSSYWARGTRSTEQITGWLLEAVAIGEELGDDEMRAEALWWLVPAYVALRDRAAADAVLRGLFEPARRLNEPFRLHVAEQYASALALASGDLDEAGAAAMRSSEWARLLVGRDASSVHGIQMFGIRREQGRLAELAPVVRVLAASAGQAWTPGLAAMLAELGMDADARRVLDSVRADGLDPRKHTLWLATLTYLTDAAAALSDEALARELYPLLAPHAGSIVQIGHLVACQGAADRYLGMLATTLGEWSLAERHFEEGLALDESFGSRTWHAHGGVEYARMLLRRRSGDDRARATALLAQAAAAARECGLVAVLSRVGALGGVVDLSGTLPDGLSAREADVLALLASGLSNREIGRRMIISEHTVANHVRSILRKTGTANRTEAAAYAHRRGLAGS